MRIVGLVFILLAVFSAIVSIFWYQELQYLLPTPVPKDYRVIVPNEVIKFDDKTLLSQTYSKPKLLHFFSPECPCSRFNIKHFLSLNRKYNREIDFFVVVSNPDRVAPAKKLIEKDITIIVDENEKLAKACGVYSTPQAALVQTDNKLYFRGNYNRSRYCTDKNSNFVQMAMDSLLAERNPPHFIELATQSYGCILTQEQDSLKNDYSFFK
jgi:hypothetical protein